MCPLVAAASLLVTAGLWLRSLEIGEKKLSASAHSALFSLCGFSFNRVSGPQLGFIVRELDRLRL